jgi:hypothetical protein
MHAWMCVCVCAVVVAASGLPRSAASDVAHSTIGNLTPFQALTHLRLSTVAQLQHQLQVRSPWLDDSLGMIGSGWSAAEDDTFGSVTLTGHDATTQLLQITLDLCAQLLGSPADPSSGVTNQFILLFVSVVLLFF